MDAQTHFDPHTLVFALLVSLLAAVIFGLVPALRASKVDHASAMKTGGGTMGMGAFRIGSGNLLVMAQVALSCVLLVVGGLFLRSMQFARTVDPGFDRTGITMFSVSLQSLGYGEARAMQLTSGWWMACGPFPASIPPQSLTTSRWMPTTLART